MAWSIYSIYFFCLIRSFAQGSESNFFSAKCSYVLEEQEGFFATKNYPNDYPAEFSCVWTIKAPPRHYVQLTFIDFDVEPYDDCQTDVLEIKDGGDIESPLIGILENSADNLRLKGGQYCNQRRPPKVITSTYNELRLWFSSDSTIQLRGFKAAYKFIKEQDCGGEIFAEFGEITTPRFPLHYPRDRKCEWKIKVPKGKYVSLKFLYFEVESSCPAVGPCQCLDTVSLKDGHSNDAKSLGTYCFASPPEIYASSNELSVIFSSDLYGRLQGFKATFTQSSTERCGGDFISSNGTVSYPPDNIYGRYPPFSECVWTLTVASGEYVELQFVDLDIAASPMKKCSEDYLEIRDGSTDTAPLIGKFCNAFFRQTVISTKNSMFINFHSDDRNTGRGFKAFFKGYKKPCSSSLGMEDRRILKTSLTASSTFKIAHRPYELAAKYGRLNNRLAWCSQEHKNSFVDEYFQISFKLLTKVVRVATQGYSMYGNPYYVTEYKVSYSTGTSLKNFLTEEDASKGFLYTVFTGNHNYNTTKDNVLSPAIISNNLRIEPLAYHSGKRLHVCMRLEIYGCQVDAEITHLLTKPNDQVEYNSIKKSTMNWILSPETVTDNSVYMLEIKKLQADCKSSKLRISLDGESFTQNNTFCSEKALPDVIVRLSSQQLWLQFDIVSLPHRFQGFEFAYNEQKLGLGRLITSVHGVVTGEHNMLCSQNVPSVWLLQFPSGYKIKLEFERVQLPTENENRKAFLYVKSGLLDSSHIAYKLEGYLQQPSAFIYSKNLLRIEYHSSSIGRMERSNGFILKYTAWRDGIRSNDREII